MSAAAQGVDPPFDLTDPTFIARGRAMFNERCAGRCHGPDGREGMEAPILTGKHTSHPGLSTTRSLPAGRERDAELGGPFLQ